MSEESEGKAMSEAIEFLKQMPAFAGVDEGGLQRLFAFCQEIEFSPDTAIVREGEEGDCVYLIKEGEVEISMAITLKINSEESGEPGEQVGRDKVLVRLGPGNMFGEMAFIFDTDQRTATVMTLTPVRLLRLRSEEFSRFARSDYENAYKIIRNIAKIISGRLKKTNQDVVKLTTVLSLVLSKAPRG
jgi:CRP/FNR family cyclic AMP-dependent transcriptional regulator